MNVMNTFPDGGNKPSVVKEKEVKNSRQCLFVSRQHFKKSQIKRDDSPKKYKSKLCHER